MQIVKIKVSKDNKPFGAISSKDIAEEIEIQTGHAIDKKKILFKNNSTSIKNLGANIVTVKLHKDVKVDVIIKVEACNV